MGILRMGRDKRGEDGLPPSREQEGGGRGWGVGFVLVWGGLEVGRLADMKFIVNQCQRLVDSKWFEPAIIAIIVANSLILGLETSKTLEERFGEQMHLGNQVALGIFIVEAIIKMVALAPRSYRYFKDGWNVFDFIIIVAALIPATGQFAVIARLARLLRALRLISAVRELRLIISALVRSIPSVGHVMVLMGIIVYIYAIMGYHFFHAHDPENWGSLGLSLLTLFNIITLEGWIEVMATAMELNGYSWIYFVSFVVVGDVRGHQPAYRDSYQQPGRGEVGAATGVGDAGDGQRAAEGDSDDAGVVGAAGGAAGEDGGFGGEAAAGLEPGNAVAEDAGFLVVGVVFGVGADGLYAVSEGGFGPGFVGVRRAVAPELVRREDDVAVYGVAG